MTPEQIANLASGVGFRGDGLTKAVAVALAESGGNERAQHVNADRYRSIDRGLWQINSHWHPEVSAAQAFNPATAAAAAYRISRGGADWSQWSTWPLAAGAQLARARLAAAPYLRAQNYTYPTTPGGGVTGPPVVTPAGSGGTRGNAGGGGGATGQPVGFVDDYGKWLGRKLGENPELFTMPGDMLGAVSQAVALFAKGGAWVSDAHNWKRIAFVVGGGAALLIGAQQLASSGSLGSTAAGVAGIPGKAAGLIPAGKIAKAAKAAT